MLTRKKGDRKFLIEFGWDPRLQILERIDASMELEDDAKEDQENQENQERLVSACSQALNDFESHLVPRCLRLLEYRLSEC